MYTERDSKIGIDTSHDSHPILNHVFVMSRLGFV